MAHGTLPFPSPCPLPPTQRAVWSLQQLLLGSRDLAHLLCAVCSQAASSSWASDLAFVIYSGTEQSKHSPCQACSFDSVAEPQGKYLPSRLWHKSPEALKGLWFFSFSSPLPLGVSHSSCPQHGLVQWHLMALLLGGPCACRGVQERSWLPRAAGWALSIPPLAAGHCWGRGRSEPPVGQMPAQPR